MGSETRPQHPLRTARKAAKLRQADVAKKAGISISYVSMIEAGLLPPSSVQERLASAVKSNTTTLFGSTV